MMKEISDVVACVRDRGIFFPVAERLAQGFKKVYYNRPNSEAFETVAQYCLGDGHSKVQFLDDDDFWKVKNEIDVLVCPDCCDWGLQMEWESQGKPVWGSKDAGRIEKMRGDWLKVCSEYGLPMPRTYEVRGITNLAAFLKENEDKQLFVKISRFRGDMETWQAKTPARVARKLEYLSLRWGPLKERIKFYVQEAVETHIESGSDTYNIHGQWPDEIIIGYEKKAESYFGTVKKRSAMPPEVWQCNEAISQLLQEARYANFISSEVRVDKEGKGYWLDPCFRCPSPAGEEELVICKNFPEIVWEGAHGQLVQPEWRARFFGEAVISYCGEREGWKSLELPEEVKEFVKLYATAQCDNAYHFPPCQEPEAIGCAVGIGNTPDEVVQHLKEIEECLKEQPVELHIEPMADLFKEIKEAMAQGIEFSGQPLPEPAMVLE